MRFNGDGFGLILFDDFKINVPGFGRLFSGFVEVSKRKLQMTGTRKLLDRRPEYQFRVGRSAPFDHVVRQRQMTGFVRRIQAYGIPQDRFGLRHIVLVVVISCEFHTMLEDRRLYVDQHFQNWLRRIRITLPYIHGG